MSKKLKFKIISCSSEQQEHPVSSLLFSGSEGWQTRRFCTYPQEITLEFYGVVNIRKIELVSDHRKISSQVDILYYVPTGGQEQRFYKYGYFQFSRNENGGAREQKTIMVDLNCLYLRLLFHKPHPAKDNFFSQIGLQALALFGSEQPDALLREPASQQVGSEEGTNEEDEEYINQFKVKLTADKQQAIRNEDYDKAEQYRNAIVQIDMLAKKLREQRAFIARAVEREDFDEAKLIKENIQKIKADIRDILEDDADEEQPLRAEEENQFAEPIQDQNNNEFMEGQIENYSSLPNSKVSNKNKLAQSRPIRQAPQKPREDYDERVIPALRSDRLKSEAEQQGEQKPKQLPPAEQVQGKYIKQATFMQQFFEEQTVRKFFSQYWQHNLQSLNTILAQIKKKNKQPNLIRCLANVVKFSIRQTNFQVAVVSLTILQQMLRTNTQSQSVTKPGDMQNDLDDIGREVIKKMTDNNPKIKAAADQAFALMVSSLLYGVETCSISLTKNKAKLSSKQLATRLMMITKMIDDYGIASGANTVPLSVLDFAIENLNHSAEQVRKNAVALLAAAYRKDKNKTDIKISDLKDAIQNQVRGEGTIHTPPKTKKK